MRTIYLIHGWDGNPENCWFPWLKRELEKRNFKVKSLAMPNSDNPNLNEWVNFLNKNIQEVDEQNYLIGHSMGCRAIIGFLENCKTKFSGIIFVAGWVVLNNLGTEEEKEIAKQWTTKKIDYKKVVKKTKKFVAIFSDNDPYVSLEENLKFYKEKLKAEIVIEKEKGHFDDDSGIKELPIVLNKILEISK